jgi:hypothetical protein
MRMHHFLWWGVVVPADDALRERLYEDPPAGCAAMTVPGTPRRIGLAVADAALVLADLDEGVRAVGAAPAPAWRRTLRAAVESLGLTVDEPPRWWLTSVVL